MLHKFSHKCYWIIPRLHFKRAEYICCLWTDKLTEGMKPEKSGWLKEDDGEYSVQFQDVTDQYPKIFLLVAPAKKIVDLGVLASKMRRELISVLV